MRPSVRSVFVAALLAAGPALATSEPEAPPESEVIGIEEWRALTAGRTVWYSLRGRPWGREHFHKGRDEATFMTPQGECMTAPWMYRDGIFCFAYGGMHCFRHLRRDGEIFAAPLDGGEEQKIERIDDAPVSCEPPLSS